MNKKIILSLLACMLFSPTIYAREANIAETDRHIQEDPFEGFNRAVFAFNDTLDIYILTPVARGYRAITTQSIRNRVNGIFSNLKEPASGLYHILQGEPAKASSNIGRFIINSTLGLAGMFDVANGWGIKPAETNFDKTLASWCVPDGPYIVLPLIGSGTPRSFTGAVADGFTEPAYWATVHREDGWYAYTALNAVQMIAFRESMLDLTDDLRRNSVDYYTTMRASYIQNRSKLGCKKQNENDAAAYDFDFDIDE